MNDMASDMAPPPRQLQQGVALAASLEAPEWQLVLTALQEAPLPMRLSRPVFDKLVAQLREFAS